MHNQMEKRQPERHDGAVRAVKVPGFLRIFFALDATMTYKWPHMEDASEQQAHLRSKPTRNSTAGWQILWVFLHLTAVYAIVNFVTPWLAGWTDKTLLPFLQHPTSSSRFEFLFSHLFVFSFIPAFLCGLVSFRFKSKAALFVWWLPAAVLAVKFTTFPATSVFGNRFHAAFHQYFEANFLIPEFRNWQEFGIIIKSNSDMPRGMAQLQYTAPFYAGIAYSVAAWVGCRLKQNRKVTEKDK